MRNATVINAVILCLTLAAGLFAESEDTRFLDGLRKRHLFPLAETYCRQKLNDEIRDDVELVDLTVELIQTLAAHAVNAVPAKRAALWDEAHQTANDFQRDHRASPRGVLVAVQDALTLLTEGELLRIEGAVSANPKPRLEAASIVLGEAVKSLNAIDAVLRREIPARHRRTGEQGELSATELLSLQHHFHYHLGRAADNQGLCFPPDSADRLAALTQAVDALKAPLTQISVDDPLAPRIRIRLAACYRELAEPDAARLELDAVIAGDPPPQIQLEARAEAMRLELQQNRPQAAMALAERGREIDGATSAELDFAYLETLLAAWRKAAESQRSADADSARDKAVAMVQSIEQTYGAYWGRRADLLLVHSIGGSRAGGDVEILIRTADNLYRSERYQDALETYEQAAVAALAAGDATQSFELRYKAALVAQSREQYQVASEKLRSLAVDLPRQDQAADAHLLAAWNAAQWARQTPAAIDTYGQVLEEHLMLWPDQAVADTARLWLGRLKEVAEDWNAAVAAYQGITLKRELFSDAFAGTVRCALREIDQMQGEGQSTEAFAQQIAAFFQHRIEPLLREPAQAWDDSDRLAAEHAARFLLQYTTAGFRTAQTVLEAALQSTPEPPNDWRTMAESLLVVALAGQDGQRDRAEQLLIQAGSDSPTRLLEMLDGLSRVAGAAEPKARRELADLQLAVIQRLWNRREQLAPSDRRSLAIVRGESLTLAGQAKEALAAYAEMATAYPVDGLIQEAYGEQLLSSADSLDWKQALEQWRRVGSRSRPRSERWFRAKYSIATALYKLGDKQQAIQRIRYLQAVPPGLEDTTWKARFDELLKQCQTP